MNEATMRSGEPDAGTWGCYTREIYSSFAPPILPTQLALLESMAKKVLFERNGTDDNFNYAKGSAGTSSTYNSNLAAFQDYRIIPKMLCGNSTKRDLSVELFGTRYPSPILTAPIGVLSLFHKDAELAVASATSALNIPYVMSTASTTSIEDTADANGPNGARWFQLYWPRSNDLTISLLKRAKEQRFTVLVVTLDTSILGFRPLDLDTAHLPFLSGQGCAVGFSDPVFCAKNGINPTKGKTVLDLGDKQHIMQASMQWLAETNSTIASWEDVQFLRDNWQGPVVLKGILSVADALKAADIGVEGIIVSNHGGRQIDGSVAALHSLDKIASDPRVIASGLTLLFDSGVRTGVDVIKALALGAKAVLIGRPWVYGLALEGQAGVEHVLKTILAEAETSMALMGCPKISHLNRDCLDKIR